MISVGGYLGKPGAMRELPSANGPIDAPPSRGETVHTLASGGTAVTRLPLTKRSWSLPFSSLPGSDADVLAGFYGGLFGVGPFRWVDPTVVNVLPFAVAATGAVSTQPLGWSVSSGLLAASTAAVSPVDGPGVLRWSGSRPAGAVLGLSSVASAVPLVPREFCAVSLWVSAAVAVSVTFGLYGYSTAGVAVSGASLTQSATLGSGWQRLTVVASPGEAALSSAPLLMPQLVVPGALSGDVFVAAAQVEYASSPSAWRAGAGAPAVTITGTPGRSVPQIGYSDHTLTIAEV